MTRETHRDVFCFYLHFFCLPLYFFQLNFASIFWFFKKIHALSPLSKRTRHISSTNHLTLCLNEHCYVLLLHFNISALHKMCFCFSIYFHVFSCRLPFVVPKESQRKIQYWVFHFITIAWILLTILRFIISLLVTKLYFHFCVFYIIFRRCISQNFMWRCFVSSHRSMNFQHFYTYLRKEKVSIRWLIGYSATFLHLKFNSVGMFLFGLRKKYISTH